MTDQEKLGLLEEMMELDSGTLKDYTELANLEQWDSLAKLSLIALVDEKFGKSLTGEQIRAFKTVKDILDSME
jgi:acyl carrier protein